jgi:hypothetical protein
VVPTGELLQALVAEAARKSRVCWLAWSGRPATLAWHAWYDGALLVLAADGEQPLPGLADAATVEVTFRSKDTGGRLVRWTGRVEVVDPDDPAWEAGAAALLAVRLNLPDPAAALLAWRTEGTIVRVVPTGEAGPEQAGPLP